MKNKARNTEIMRRLEIGKQRTAVYRPLQVGDIVLRRPYFTSDGNKRSEKLSRGTVVYVHPKGRFHVVEFGKGKNAVKESFPGVGTHGREGDAK